jgi:uncharacterized membrane protein
MFGELPLFLVLLLLMEDPLVTAGHAGYMHASYYVSWNILYSLGSTIDFACLQ